MFDYITVRTDGNEVYAKLYHGEHAEKVNRAVIYTHGFGGNKENRSAQMLAEGMIASRPDTALMTYDLPCHGEDGSARLEIGRCHEYMASVLGYMKERFSPEEVYACGNSFGGYLTLRYMSLNDSAFRKAALRCPAVEMYNVLTGLVTPEQHEALGRGQPIDTEQGITVFPEFVRELREADITESDYTARSINKNIIIVHGTEDEVVPFESVRRFADRNIIRFVPIEGADHRFTAGDTLETAVSIMRGFIES